MRRIAMPHRSLVRRVGGHVSSAGGIVNAINNTLEIGGNALQIFAGSPRMWKRSLYQKSDAAKFKQLAKDNDLNPVYIHALYLTNLASDNPELRKKSRTALITDMTNSAAIGSAGVVLHIGSHQGRGFEAVQDTVADEIKTVLDNTPPESILLLENSAGQKGKIGTFPELNYLLSQLDTPRVKICLDTAHAFESGYALNSAQGVELFVKDIKKHLSIKKVELLHLNDSRTPLGSGRDIHENLGEGFIGKAGIEKIVNHSDLNHLPLILEVPGFEGSGPDAKNIKIVKSLVN